MRIFQHLVNLIDRVRGPEELELNPNELLKVVRARSRAQLDEIFVLAVVWLAATLDLEGVQVEPEGELEDALSVRASVTSIACFVPIWVRLRAVHRVHDFLSQQSERSQYRAWFRRHPR